MRDPVNVRINALNRPMVLLLRLVLLVPLIGILLFDPGGVQSWVIALGMERGNGLLALSLIGEVDAILAAFSILAESKQPGYLVVNIAILVASLVSYFWGCFVGLFMGMEPVTAMVWTGSILISAVVVRLVVPRSGNRL